MLSRTGVSSGLVAAGIFFVGCANPDARSTDGRAPGNTRPDVLSPTDPSGAPSDTFGTTDPRPMPSGTHTPGVTFPPPPTPPPAPVPTPAPPSTPQPQTYSVQPGDTLWTIAVQHYGNGQKWKQIADANPGLNPDKMPVGKSIMLP